MTGRRFSGDGNFWRIHFQHTAQFAVTSQGGKTQTAPAKGPLLLGQPNARQHARTIPLRNAEYKSRDGLPLGKGCQQWPEYSQQLNLSTPLYA
jgi:hypothetical protein